MHRLTIWQKYYAEETALHFLHLRPAPNAAICLDDLPNGGLDRLLNPSILNSSSISTSSYHREVTSDLHL